MEKKVEIVITELPRKEEDSLEEELFWINLYLDDTRPKCNDRSIQLTKRKKEIEERLKLIELEKDF